MKQPELGRRLTALRKERNLTQEELVEKSHVSVRTIQRIESGEVMPRLSTVKILVNALGESYESFSTKSTQSEEQQKSPPVNHYTLLVAALAGVVYLVSEIILGAIDLTRFTGGDDWGYWMNTIYTGTTVVMVVSFTLFARGFIALSTVFENSLLKVISYLLIIGMVGMGILDVSSLSVKEVEMLWIPYSVAALLLGSMSIVFGIALLRLQDSMGELARIAGILEIVMGCLLVTVVLFFITYIILIPATILEILILYRGYEYLSKSESTGAAGA